MWSLTPRAFLSSWAASAMIGALIAIASWITGHSGNCLCQPRGQKQGNQAENLQQECAVLGRVFETDRSTIRSTEAWPCTPFEGPGGLLAMEWEERAVGGEPGRWEQGQVVLGGLGCHSEEANTWSRVWDGMWGGMSHAAGSRTMAMCGRQACYPQQVRPLLW